MENIKIGDRVIISTRFSPSKIAVVSKVFKKYFEAGGYNFNFNGYIRGSNFYDFRCENITPEKEGQIIKEQKIRYINNYIVKNLNTFDDDKLNKLYELVKEF